MDKIPLSEMLGQLRKELLQAQGEGKGADLKFLMAKGDPPALPGWQ